MEGSGARLAQSDRVAPFDGGYLPFSGRPGQPAVAAGPGSCRGLGFQAICDGLGQVRHPVGLTGGVEAAPDGLLGQVAGPVGCLLDPPA